MQKSDLLPWQQENWLLGIENWATTQLHQHNIKTISRPILIHSAPWSVVYKIFTNQVPFYFKALCPVLNHEPLLTQQLFHWQPGMIQPVLEIEPDKGWMLMPEGGTTLRQVLEQNPTLNYWKKILPAYARFQQAMIPHQQELLVLGVKDRSLAVLPGLVKRLAEERQALCIGQPDGLSPADYEAFLGYLPKLKTKCEILSQFGIPETLQHDDLHDGNIFIDQNGFKFFDWAESFIAHPFFTLVVTLRSIAYRFELEESSPEIRELTDLYLKEWLDYAKWDGLQEAFELAMVIGRINRALTWHMVVSTLPEPDKSKEADAVPGWVQLFLEKITPCA